MKKILCFCLCFFLLSSNCFAYVEEVNEPKGDFSKSVPAVRSIGDAAETIIATTEDAAWQVINKLAGAGRSVIAVADRGLDFLKSFFEPRIRQQGYEPDEWVNTYISIDNSNNYVLSNNAINMFSAYADYCFHGVENEPVTYPCIDIFGKNFVFSDNSQYVNMEWLYEVCRRYQDNYYISIQLADSNYEQNYYFKCARQTLIDNTLPDIVLEPKTMGYLVPNVFNTDNQGIVMGFYSQSGNGGGTAGNVLYDYLTVDQNYNLVQRSASSSSPPRGLFALRIMKSGNLFLQFTDIFKNQTKTQRIPIVYQRNEVIELYNNGYPAPNPNAHVCFT